MLSFQVDEKGTIQINCDAKGVGVLLEVLGRLQRSGSDHVHLRSPFAGGKDLDEVTPFGEKAVDEIVIDYLESVT